MCVTSRTVLPVLGRATTVVHPLEPDLLTSAAPATPTLDGRCQGPTGEVAPLLRKLMTEYAATGIPPAYLPQKPQDEEHP